MAPPSFFINLLFFVTARLMKNDGGAMTNRQVGGEPDFNR